jgi:NitT/TauT family transport system substrate-binding protein
MLASFSKFSFRAVKHLICIFFVIFISSQLISCDTKPVALRIALPIWPGYDVLYLANELGYFDNQRFSVHILEFNSPTDAVAAYQRGDVNILAVTLIELLRAYSATGRPSNIILLADFSNGSDKIIAKENVRSVKELKGKRVGYERGAVPHYHLIRALELNHMDIKDIISVATDNDRAEYVVKNDLVDAVVTYPPASTTIVNLYNYHEIFNSTSIPGEIVDVIAADVELLAQAPELQKYFMSVWDKTLHYMQENQQAALEIIAGREKISVDELAQAYNYELCRAT